MMSHERQTFTLKLIGTFPPRVPFDRRPARELHWHPLALYNLDQPKPADGATRSYAALTEAPLPALSLKSYRKKYHIYSA